MSNVRAKVFSHTHYGVSTVAAVLYAIAWLLGNQVHAETRIVAVLPPTIVTAPRIDRSTVTLDPVVVTSARQVHLTQYAILEPVIVQGSRNVAAEVRSDTFEQETEATLSSAVASVENIARASGRIETLWATLCNWGLSALLK